MTTTKKAKENIVSYLNNSGPTPPTHIAIGTSNIQSSSEDLSLGNEITRVAIETKDFLSPNEIAYTATIDTSTANGQTIREIGLFNAASNGTMFSRGVFSDLVKDSSFSIEITVVLRIL